MKLGSYIRTPETRAKNRAAVLGNKNCVGRIMSPETRVKIGAANTGKRRSAEVRAKMSAASKGRVPTAETRAKLRAANSAALGTESRSDAYTIVRIQSGWEYRHRLVAGLTKGDGKVAHHRDGDSQNNDLSNIRVYESNAAHRREHAKSLSRDAAGRFAQRRAS